jgi:ABC-type nitrate/sulfonate/bicarbonate transport system substrate-binding protein
MTRPVSRRAFLGATAAGSALFLAACATLRPPGQAASGGAAAKPPKALTFMAGYKPQANVSFVGVYVAQDMGYFREQGLDVTIKHSSGQGEEVKLLAAKQIQVITEIATDLIKHVAEEAVPFVSLAVLTQRGDEAIATLKASGIDAPKKLEGKTVGYKVVPTFEYLAMLKATGVDRAKIREVPVGFDPRVLTEGKVDALPVFKSNEPDVLRRLGFEVNVLDPDRYGVDVLGQLWVTHRDLLAADPDLFERFDKAALNGLSYAFAHPKEGIDIVMKYAPTEDRAHQEYMLATEKDSALTEQTSTRGLGWQTLDQWSRLQDGLVEFGLIKTKVDPATFFADQIQQRVYQNGKLVWP